MNFFTRNGPARTTKPGPVALGSARKRTLFWFAALGAMLVIGGTSWNPEPLRLPLLVLTAYLAVLSVYASSSGPRPPRAARSRLRRAVEAAALSGAGYVLSIIASKVWYHIVGAGAEASGTLPPGLPDVATLARSFVTAAVLVPIVEEVVFRQHLLDLASPYLGRAGSVLGTAAAFGLTHYLRGYNLRDAGDTFLFGVVAAVLRLASGGILVPTIVHGLFNGIVVIAQVPN